MAGPGEVRRIIHHTGLTWGEVAEPYPAFLEGQGGCRYTFEWALRRENGRCAFFDGSRCRIYPVRPWICRTYPFMLEGSELCISECAGLGERIADATALALAVDLLQRQEGERREDERVARHIATLGAFRGRSVVIDGEGVTIIEP